MKLEDNHGGDLEQGSLMRGFAAAQCGKALPFRADTPPGLEATPPIFRGIASKDASVQKGPAFPHRAAAQPRDDSSTDFSKSPKLRLLVVGPSLDILGGQAVQAERLIKRLQEEPSLEVGFLPINPRLPGLLRKLQAIKYVRTLVTSIWYVASLLSRVRQYDVIHIFSASYFSFVLAPTPAILIARFYGKKIVLNYHSGEATDHLERWPSAIKTLKLADQLAVPSEYLARVFSQFGLRAKAIYNTIETGVFHFRARPQLGLRFLSNRNLEAHYGVDCVLRAFALIQQRHPQASLTVAGDGSQRRRLEELAAELQLKNVEFKGQVNHASVVELYDAADIYLNGSLIDNQPLSLLEAFACGLPVVSTNAGGIPDIVSHERTGLLVECGDYRGMAEAALRLLADEGLTRRIITQAREECRKYSWAAVRDQWLELYEGLGPTGVKSSSFSLCAYEGTQSKD